MFDFQITGFEQFTAYFEELTEATKQLSGKLCQVHFDPSRADQVQTAIEEMERAVTERLSEFTENSPVRQFANGIKQKFKEEILKRADEARHCLAAGGIPFDPHNNYPLAGAVSLPPPRRWSRNRQTIRRTI